MSETELVARKMAELYWARLNGRNDPEQRDEFIAASWEQWSAQAEEVIKALELGRSMRGEVKW